MLKKILNLLSASERKQIGKLMAMTLMMAFLDMLGVASIMPFMAVLSNPEVVETNEFLRVAYEVSTHIGIQNNEQFLFMMGSLVFILLIVSLAFKALTTYLQSHFVFMRSHSISLRLIESYLHQSYSWLLTRNSADLGKYILSEVNTVVLGSMTPMINLVSQVAVAFALLTLLIVVDLKLALTVGLVLSISYILIYKVTRSRLGRIGKERLIANQGRFLAVSEAFGALKEVKVSGLEQFYIQNFSGPSHTYSRHQVSVSIISQLPRFALEALAFGGMLLLILYLMTQRGGFANTLPTIALYVFAGYKLLPALQKSFAAIAKLRFIAPALDSLHQDIASLQATDVQQHHLSPLPITQAITLSQVSYSYPKAAQPALKRVNLSIASNSKVGFVGTTGSGKTTIVDVILGLLQPQEGVLKIDSQPITDANRRRWQSTIGFVPQQIYLADDSVAANIAFGVNSIDIDLQAVERAAKIANLHEFVVNDLPRGYATKVGERGVRLSGGQRQRIGIARALYHNPQVLILDEATSALDNLTEEAVMEAVSNMSGKLTVIMIAHRLSTVRKCDQIHLLERGEVVASGTYDELIAKSKQFKTMAKPS